MVWIDGSSLNILQQASLLKRQLLILSEHVHLVPRWRRALTPVLTTVFMVSAPVSQGFVLLQFLELLLVLFNPASNRAKQVGRQLLT